jgi:hypothetical protein
MEVLEHQHLQATSSLGLASPTSVTVTKRRANWTSRFLQDMEDENGGTLWEQCQALPRSNITREVCGHPCGKAFQLATSFIARLIRPHAHRHLQYIDMLMRYRPVNQTLEQASFCEGLCEKLSLFCGENRSREKDCAKSCHRPVERTIGVKETVESRDS